MPTSKELVSNRPLRGDELAAIIQRDLSMLLSNDCMMTSHNAFGRVAYDLRLTLHMDNFSYPEHRAGLTSRGASDQELAERPELAAIESTLPLSPPLSEDAFVSAVERQRIIESPNLARIEASLPVTIVRRGDSGQSIEEGVTYPPDIVDGAAPPPVDLDLTRMTKEDFASASAKSAASPQARGRG